MPRSKSQPRPSANPRTIVGVAVAIAAVVFGVPALLVVVPSQNAPPLSDRADRLLAALEARQPAERYQQSGPVAAQLQALANDPQFSELPPAKQEQVRAVLHKLAAFQDYQRQLDAIAEPQTARTEEALQQIQKQLVELGAAVEAGHDLEWKQTEAGLRYARMSEDVLALHTGIAEMTQQYGQLVADGEAEITTKRNDADLPGRVKKVLERAAALPTPDSQQPIRPGSRVRYGTVFRFSSVADVYQRQWLPLRSRLEKLSLSAGWSRAWRSVTASIIWRERPGDGQAPLPGYGWTVSLKSAAFPTIT